jgi:hypothetical protein
MSLSYEEFSRRVETGEIFTAGARFLQVENTLVALPKKFEARYPLSLFLQELTEYIQTVPSDKYEISQKEMYRYLVELLGSLNYETQKKEISTIIDLMKSIV